MDAIGYQSENAAMFAYSATWSQIIWILHFPTSSTILTPLKWLFEGKQKWYMHLVKTIKIDKDFLLENVADFICKDIVILNHRLYVKFIYLKGECIKNSPSLSPISSF